MICPFIKDKEIKIETTHLPLKDSTTIKNTETFHRCIGGECPYYYYYPTNFKDYCMKIRKEITLLINDKGEIK